MTIASVFKIFEWNISLSFYIHWSGVVDNTKFTILNYVNNSQIVYIVSLGISYLEKYGISIYKFSKLLQICMDWNITRYTLLRFTLFKVYYNYSYIVRSYTSYITLLLPVQYI